MKNADTDYQFDQKDANAILEDINPLPRSVVRQTPFVLLDGEWRFALDLEDRGLLENWHVEHEYEQTASFPGSIESQLEKIRDRHNIDASQHEALVAWYEREFSNPVGWSELSDYLTQLTFGACGYETRVWLNGTLLKTIEGEEVHFGEYNSFSYEFPPDLLKPVNRLTIRVADPLDAEIPRGKQASRVYKQGGIWYQTISGAVRSVWIEPVKRNRLRSRVTVTSSLRNHLVEFDLTTRVHDAGHYTLRLTATPFDKEKGEPLAQAEFPLILEAGERPQRFPLEIPGAEIWSPESPNLYHLVAELIAPDGGIAGIETHFGLRKIEARGRHIYLNNKTIYLDGILYQPGTSTYEEIKRHFHSMKKLGCNLVRVHIAGIDPRIYDLADRMGMLLWVEIPSPHSSTQRSRDIHWAELQRMLVFIGSHPSIVIWSLYNEDWGAEDIRTNPETRRYIASTFDWMRTRVPQVLVVDNDGWNHVSRYGRLKSHLLTAHIYTPDADAWASALDRLISGDIETVAAQPLTVGDPYFYRGQVPLVISEWGGFGFSNYGGPGEEDSGGRAERIRHFKREMRRASRMKTTALLTRKPANCSFRREFSPRITKLERKRFETVFQMCKSLCKEV
jgi:beta-galactosidase/beta-glucuronidase